MESNLQRILKSSIENRGQAEAETEIHCCDNHFPPTQEETLLPMIMSTLRGNLLAFRV